MNTFIIKVIGYKCMETECSLRMLRIVSTDFIFNKLLAGFVVNMALAVETAQDTHQSINHIADFSFSIFLYSAG